VAWASECKATQRDVSHLQSSQEEADTKMILHALDAASNGSNRRDSLIGFPGTGSNCNSTGIGSNIVIT